MLRYFVIVAYNTFVASLLVIATSINHIRLFSSSIIQHSTITTMNQGYWAQEARIDEAMAYLSINPNAFVARIAREYDVLPRKL